MTGVVNLTGHRVRLVCRSSSLTYIVEGLDGTRTSLPVCEISEIHGHGPTQHIAPTIHTMPTLIVQRREED